MINHVSLNGILCKVENNSSFRYIKVIRHYKDNKGIFNNDYIPCMMWTKDNKNELFSYKEGTFVSIDGRLETIDEKIYVVVEQLTIICNSDITYKKERT